MNVDPARFKVGDIVNVVKHGRAIVLGTNGDGRIHVKYCEDGTTFHCNPTKLRKLQMARQRIVVCFYTIEFRHAMVHNLDMSSSVVLEIGCHEGVCTNMIFKRSAYVVGVDVDQTAIQVARTRNPRIRFEVCDGGQVNECLSLAEGRDFNVITIDVSGQAPLSLLLPILHAWAEKCPEALIIVKNRRLYHRLAFGHTLHEEEKLGTHVQSMLHGLIPLCETFQRTDLSEEERQMTEETKRVNKP